MDVYELYREHPMSRATKLKQLRERYGWTPFKMGDCRYR